MDGQSFGGESVSGMLVNGSDRGLMTAELNAVAKSV